MFLLPGLGARSSAQRGVQGERGRENPAAPAQWQSSALGAWPPVEHKLASPAWWRIFLPLRQCGLWSWYGHTFNTSLAVSRGEACEGDPNWVRRDENRGPRVGIYTTG